MHEIAEISVAGSLTVWHLFGPAAMGKSQLSDSGREQSRERREFRRADSRLGTEALGQFEQEGVQNRMAAHDPVYWALPRPW